MSRTSLTLAALATAAVAGLDVARTRTHSYDETGDYDAAVLETRDGGELLIRVPLNDRADAEQSAELVALGALTPGARARLPFAVPMVHGQAPVPETRAVVYDFLFGHKVTPDGIPEDTLGASMGRAIAAIHALPTTTVLDAGLPVRSSQQVREETQDLLERALATRLVPLTIVTHWQSTLDDDEIWQFAPTVVHGSLDVESFLVTGERVAGVLGWRALRAADPAVDLVWAIGVPPETGAAVVDAYAGGSGASRLPLLRRAGLYSELEIARWLLYGREQNDDTIVQDAVGMLDNLVDRVRDGVSAAAAPGATTEDRSVTDLLESAPRAGAAAGREAGGPPLDPDPGANATGSYAPLVDDDEDDLVPPAPGASSDADRAGAPATDDQSRTSSSSS